MQRTAAAAAGVLGAAGTAAAVAWAPWSFFAGPVTLQQFPGWGWYLAAAICLHLLVCWALLVPSARQAPPVVELILVAATVLAALVVMWHYDDAAAFFDGPVPLVVPMPGPGGPMAILAALISGIALATRPTGGTAMPAEAGDAP